MQLIDTHCHLDYDYSPKTIEEILREAQGQGISHFMTIGVDMASIPKLVPISERFDCVHHTVGVHPHEAITVKAGDMDLLAEAAKHPKCRGIGEIGLDYHYDHSPRDVQKAVLEMQLELALKVNLPIVIHSRDAEDDLLEALTRYARRVPAGNPVGIIHCFSGSQAFGQACIDLGFYVSFSGILTFKTAESLREAAKAYPLERLLVETDSPYLAPIPHRGKKCEPSMVRLTAQKLAELKGLSLEEVARVTTENAKRIFKLD